MKYIRLYEEIDFDDWDWEEEDTSKSDDWNRSKQKLLDDLRSRENPDDILVHAGRKSYTAYELADEIEKETEIGKGFIRSSIEVFKMSDKMKKGLRDEIKKNESIDFDENDWEYEEEEPNDWVIPYGGFKIKLGDKIMLRPTSQYYKYQGRVM